jgi:organic hydroperoxide reductase OsmC/OhrA
VSTAAAVSTHRARVVWEGGSEDLRAHTVHVGDQAIGGSCAAERGGDPARADPEEMFVGAVSACHMLWFLDFARRERRRVRSYVDRAEGEMDGTRFTRIVLRPRVEWIQEMPGSEDLARLHRAAHEACFLANSVACPVEVEPE